MLTIETKPTKPFPGQKPGTSGLRKPTKTFMQPGYTENFIQSILNAAVGDHLKKSQPVRLLLGGDGRYFVRESLQRIIIPICLANGVSEVLVGQNGIISTPAASCVIRKHGLTGGILLTASHNPGGPNADFGIKYNCENGGPAPEKVTDAIFAQSEQLTAYKTIKETIDVQLNSLSSNKYTLSSGQSVTVTVISSVADYADYMSTLFDFSAIKALLTGSSGQQPFKLLVSGLNGVMGPYIHEILCGKLGLDTKYAIKAIPLEDFGGGHPDPNLTYAADLVQMVTSDATIAMAAAFDGDGDRNMLIGRRGFFVSPCDSLAVIADNTDAIKYFREHGVHGFARSMPTSRALNLVCERRSMKCYEVPTGWKFFGNLMDAKLCSVCGEESFGTGSDHIREKDGLWALLAWLSILASRCQTGLPVDVESIVKEHWKKYGRYFFTRYDYENCESSQGDEIMNRLKKIIVDNGIAGQVYNTTSGQQFIGDFCDNFSYSDPVDGSQTTNQGFRLIFKDGTRFVYRLSGTGSSGATLRMYIDTYEADPKRHELSSQEYLKPHIELALKLCGLPANSESHKTPGEIDLEPGNRGVHFNSEMVNEDCTSHNLSTVPTHPQSSSHPPHVSRKVSFSDLPIISGTTEERHLDGGIHPSRITAEDEGIYDEDDDSGHHIEVRLLDPTTDDMPMLPSNFTNVSVYEVKLGMLKQATVYRVEFTIPDRLKPGEVEMLRTVVEMDGHVSVPVNVGASFVLLSCEPVPSPNHGHVLVMEVSTTKQPRVNELMTLRRVETPSDAICLLLHGISLAKGQGTPLLRSGIHRIHENQEYIDSDEYTEWPGFVNI
uniref:phosphoglucomutase (alpha-D-glucose-1,6-bisphosphate-dependent) n=1 Tax=Trichobilharzia regenti TaxID=157069 RepID=A0AA85KEJ9_TRIRE